MTDIHVMEGDSARSFMRSLGVDEKLVQQVYRVRITFDNGIKVKVNEYSWSPGYEFQTVSAR